MTNIRRNNLWVFLAGSSLVLSAFIAASATKPHSVEAEAAMRIGGASRITDKEASGGYLVSLTKPGEAVRFEKLPHASKLAIRYAAVKAGTISVAVNEQPAVKVNVHSSGALTGSFLHAIVDMPIPARASLTIKQEGEDIGLNIDQILTGKGNLGLPPDIWNLPPLKVAAGPYPADWMGLSRMYSVPQWWQSLEPGRIGIPNPCRSKATGMREACICRETDNINPTSKTLVIPRNTGTKTFAITGSLINGIPKN
jgi:hypothetical protein